MERFKLSTTGTFFMATLFAGVLLLGGCSDSLTGPQQAQEDVTVQDRAQHNMNDVDTDPGAGHNTTNED